MADMVTVQELENAKIDARTIGESVNENKIVTPRYGAPFKSMPMIAEEMQSIIGTIIAGGVPASIVLDGNQTQGEINLYGGKKYDIPIGGYPIGAKVLLDDNVTEVVNTVAANTANPNSDMTGWLSIKGTQFPNLLLNMSYADRLNIKDALQRTIDSMQDGQTLYIPKCPWGAYNLSGQVKITNKNINIICDDIINVVPSADPNFLFTRNDNVEVAGTTLSELPKKWSSKLNFITLPSEITNPSDWYVIFVSSEYAIRRISPGMYYQKIHTADIVSHDFSLRDSIPYDYEDLSKLTLRFVKKGTPTTVQLRLKPTIQPTVSSNYIRFFYTSNVEINKIVVDITNKQFSGQICAFDYTLNMTATNSIIKGANAVDSDSYPFSQYASSYLKLSRCGFYNTDQALKTERGISGRHGFNVEIDNCLFGGVDDHWGHNYLVKNMNMTRGVGISGGSVTIEDCRSNDVLFTQREDTPYNDGKLIIRNSSTTNRLIYSRRMNETLVTSKFKFFDIVDVEADIYTSRASVSESMLFSDASNSDESFHDTIATFKLNVFQDSDKIIPVISVYNSPFTNNPNGSIDEMRLFKTLNIELNHNIRDTGSYGAGKVIVYGLCSDEINIKGKNSFSCGQIRCNKLSFNDTVFGFNGSTTGGALRANTIDFNGGKVLTSSQDYTFSLSTPKVNLRNLQFPTTQKAFVFIPFDNVETAFGNYFVDATAGIYSKNRNFSNFDKSRQTRYVTTAELIIPANSKSSDFTVSMPAYTPTDLLFAQLETWDSGLAVETYDNGNTVGTIRFRLVNTTSASITVPSGRSVNFKII